MKCILKRSPVTIFILSCLPRLHRKKTLLFIMGDFDAMTELEREEYRNKYNINDVCKELEEIKNLDPYLLNGV